ncbi:MAG: hypothetical protein JW939_03285 [Candidatus Thermoplasmatota archaeon]|nr:hypothetical protein [Candidatus Thermoplasmatota archaeon]
MKKIQPKTFIVMNQVLEKKVFSQRMIWRSCNNITDVSIGQVNKVFNELIKNNFVKELSKLEMRYGIKRYIDVDLSEEKRYPKYYLQDPIGLLKYISLFRSMNDLRVFESSVHAKKDQVIEELGKQGVIFSLGTAMEKTSSYYRSDEITFYSNAPDIIISNMRNAIHGDTKLVCFKMDFLDNIHDVCSDGFFRKDDDGVIYTGEVQTVIDMFCDGKSMYTKPLLERIWGVSI